MSGERETPTVHARASVGSSHDEVRASPGQPERLANLRPAIDDDHADKDPDDRHRDAAPDQDQAAASELLCLALAAEPGPAIIHAASHVVTTESAELAQRCVSSKTVSPPSPQLEKVVPPKGPINQDRHYRYRFSEEALELRQLIRSDMNAAQRLSGLLWAFYVASRHLPDAYFSEPKLGDVDCAAGLGSWLHAAIPAELLYVAVSNHVHQSIYTLTALVSNGKLHLHNRRIRIAPNLHAARRNTLCKNSCGDEASSCKSYAKRFHEFLLIKEKHCNIKSRMSSFALYISILLQTEGALLVADPRSLLREPSPETKPNNETRRTFTVPDGHYAVRDENGRATGELRPLPSPAPQNNVMGLTDDQVEAVTQLVEPGAPPAAISRELLGEIVDEALFPAQGGAA